jgi:hypothetical protein
MAHQNSYKKDNAPNYLDYIVFWQLIAEADKSKTGDNILIFNVNLPKVAVRISGGV